MLVVVTCFDTTITLDYNMPSHTRLWRLSQFDGACSQKITTNTATRAIILSTFL